MKKTGELWQHITNSFEETVFAHLNLEGKDAAKMREISKVCIKETRATLSTIQVGTPEKTTCLSTFNTGTRIHLISWAN